MYVCMYVLDLRAVMVCLLYSPQVLCTSKKVDYFYYLLGARNWQLQGIIDSAHSNDNPEWKEGEDTTWARSCITGVGVMHFVYLPCLYL